MPVGRLSTDQSGKVSARHTPEGPTDKNNDKKGSPRVNRGATQKWCQFNFS